jgi:hypothetical protein
MNNVKILSMLILFVFSITFLSAQTNGEKLLNDYTKEELIQLLTIKNEDLMHTRSQIEKYRKETETLRKIMFGYISQIDSLYNIIINSEEYKKKQIKK